MLTTFLTYVLAAMAALAVVAMALLPLTLVSGVWAWRGAKEHRAEAERLERLLNEQ